MSLKDRDSMGTIFANNNSSLVIHANTKRVDKLPSSNGFDVIAILMKHLNAIFAKISDQDVVIRINKEMVRIRDLPSTHDPNKIALKIKVLQPIALILAHHNIRIRQKANTTGALHLTISLSLGPKLPDKLTLRVENLNAMVAGISHDIISLLINDNTFWEIELPITLTI